MARKQDEWVIPEQSLELQQQLAALFKNFAPTFVRVGWLDAAPEVMLLVEVERDFQLRQALARDGADARQL